MGLFGGGFGRGSSFWLDSILGGLSGGTIGGSIGSGGVVRQDPLPNIAHNIVREKIKDSDTLAGEVLRTIEDSADELHELCTDGFFEMVIKGNEDYKTSYEIKDEADSIIGQATNRYRDRCKLFNDYLNELNNLINSLEEKKIGVSKQLNKAVNKLPTAKKINENVYTPTFEYTPSTISKICDCMGYGKISDIKRKKDSVNDYLDDAKDFEVYVSGKIADINRTEAFLESVKINLKEEDVLIDGLNLSLTKNNTELSRYQAISNELNILIVEYILDSNGKRNEKYMAAFKELKKICE